MMGRHIRRLTFATLTFMGIEKINQVAKLSSRYYILRHGSSLTMKWKRLLWSAGGDFSLSVESAN